MRCLLVSGGSADVTGVMVIDDLSVAVIPVATVVPSTILAGNFFPNPTFEVGVNMDNPSTAAPSGNWIRGGNDPTINLVITNNSVSPTHSLALVDNSNGATADGISILFPAWWKVTCSTCNSSNSTTRRTVVCV
jgi:hypothetical protein